LFVTKLQSNQLHMLRVQLFVISEYTTSVKWSLVLRDIDKLA